MVEVDGSYLWGSNTLSSSLFAYNKIIIAKNAEKSKNAKLNQSSTY